MSNYTEQESSQRDPNRFPGTAAALDPSTSPTEVAVGKKCIIAVVVWVVVGILCNMILVETWESEVFISKNGTGPQRGERLGLIIYHVGQTPSDKVSIAVPRSGEERL